MKLISNKLYDKYTKIVINRDTDLKKLSRQDLEDIFDNHCVSVGVLARTVDYFYDLIQKDKNNWRNRDGNKRNEFKIR